jgi:hypothetical protein
MQSLQNGHDAIYQLGIPCVPNKYTINYHPFPVQVRTLMHRSLTRGQICPYRRLRARIAFDFDHVSTMNVSQVLRKVAARNAGLRLPSHHTSRHMQNATGKIFVDEQLVLTCPRQIISRKLDSSATCRIGPAFLRSFAESVFFGDFQPPRFIATNRLRYRRRRCDHVGGLNLPYRFGSNTRFVGNGRLPPATRQNHDQYKQPSHTLEFCSVIS